MLSERRIKENLMVNEGPICYHLCLLLPIVFRRYMVEYCRYGEKTLSN